MGQKVCSNPECKLEYTVNENSDVGVCSFDCYEKLHCHQPEEVEFEKIEL